MFSATGTSLERYMDLLSTRQKLATANIANAETPLYRTKDIDFQVEFQSAMDGASGSPHVIEAPGLVARNDGNNVSLDRESRMLAENALRFNAASALLKSQVRVMRLAIQEGRNG